jgi:protein O-GlcNAc transferase
METLLKNMSQEGCLRKFNYRDISYKFHGIEGDHIFSFIGHPKYSFYEIGLLEYISSLNQEGVYLDIGANIGNHSVYFSNHCPSTKVISLEPERECFNFLRANMTANSVKEFEVYNVGAWDENKKAYLSKFSSYKDMGLSRIVNEPTDYEVDLVSLDEFIDEEVGLIKVDVEGSEPKVLNGAREIITKYKPIIVCETAKPNEKAMLNELLGTLGYPPTTLKFNATPTYIWMQTKQ